MAVQPEQRVRLFFRVALATVVLPVLSVPLVWSLCIACARVDREALPWRRRLIGVAVLDTLIAVGLVVAGALGSFDEPAPPPARGGMYVVGIELDPTEQGVPVVGVVNPGSPAERAGLRVGDRIVTVAGAPVTGAPDIRRAMNEREDTGECVFAIRRDGESLELAITPAWRAFEPPPKRGVFEVAPAVPRERRRVPSAPPSSFALVLAVALVAWAGRRRRATDRRAFWSWLAVTLAGSIAMAWAVSMLLAQVFGGPSQGTLLLGLLAAGLWLAALGVVGCKRFGILRRGGDVAKAISAGVLYVVAGGVRAGMLAFLLELLLRAVGTRVPLVNPVEWLTPSAPSGAALALFVLNAVILAPLAEELVFRGAVLTWLRRWMSAEASVWMSAGLFALMHFGYGPQMLVILSHGVVLGWARLRTDGLLASVVLHGLVNAVAIFVSL